MELPTVNRGEREQENKGRYNTRNKTLSIKTHQTAL